MRTETLDKLLSLLEVRLHAVGLCEVAAGWRLKLPCPEGMLVHYVLRGNGTLRTGDGFSVPFRPGTLIFVHPNCGTHELSAEGAAKDVAEWQQSSTPLAEGMMHLRAGDGPAGILSACGLASADCGGIELFEQLREPIAEPLPEDTRVLSAFTLMLDEFRNPRLGTRALTEALMKQCLVLALRSQIERGEVSLMALPALRDMRLLKALLEMIENPAGAHSLDDLARKSGMSRSLFAERFAETFDRPPMDLLKQIRLHRAANLLRNTALPIQIVALTVGYASRSYFSRAFRAAYGTDPKSFRDLARGARAKMMEESHD